MNFDFFISGTIGLDYDWATGSKGTTADEVREFLAAHADEDLTFGISSLGGYCHEAFQMYELIRSHGRVDVVVLGMTASAATIVAMGGRSVKIMPQAMMLVHNSSNYFEVYGAMDKEELSRIIGDLSREADNLSTIDEVIAAVYAARSGGDAAKYLDLMKEERWLTAGEAVEVGLADEIVADETADNARPMPVAVGREVLNHYCLPEVKKVQLPLAPSNLRGGTERHTPPSQSDTSPNLGEVQVNSSNVDNPENENNPENMSNDSPSQMRGGSRETAGGVDEDNETLSQSTYINPNNSEVESRAANEGDDRPSSPSGLLAFLKNLFFGNKVGVNSACEPHALPEEKEESACEPHALPDNENNDAGTHAARMQNDDAENASIRIALDEARAAIASFEARIEELQNQIHTLQRLPGDETQKMPADNAPQPTSFQSLRARYERINK